MQALAEQFAHMGMTAAPSGRAWHGHTTTATTAGSSGRTVMKQWEVAAVAYSEDEAPPSRRYCVTVRPSGDLGEYTRRRFTPCAADLPTLAAQAIRDPYNF